jgi:hypothetical protein
MPQRVLVVNHAHSHVCGIHDLGRRMYERLLASAPIDAGYAEANDWDSYAVAVQLFNPAAIIVNYRQDLMPWWHVGNGIPTYAVAHQYEAATIDRCAAGLLGQGFDGVLALDPDITAADPRVHPIGRPLPATVEHRAEDGPPRIGSFGFAFPHKGFAAVAAEVNDQLDEALYQLHMPEAFFNGASGAALYAPGIEQACREAITKPGIRLSVTTGHIGERELVFHLAANDVNCLFYVPGQPDAGLSSATDYLIAARRPMLLSDAAMFRHVKGPRWPTTRLGAVLDDQEALQRAASDQYATMSGQFAAGVERIVGEL